jgi:hypothetical protein
MRRDTYFMPGLSRIQISVMKQFRPVPTDNDPIFDHRIQLVLLPVPHPNATTTIEGHQLLAPPQKFGGVIKPSAIDSKQWWAPRVVPPTRAQFSADND